MSMNKKDIAKSFGDAAVTYDQVAHIQRKIGEQLFGRIEKNAVERVFDIGCGTGYFLEPLKDKSKNNNVIGVDLSIGMLNYCKKKLTAGTLLINADAENLPFEKQSIDLGFSSLALQWLQDLQPFCNELKRCLAKNGTVYIATLAENTLNELKESWQQVDSYTHVNEFHTVLQWQQAFKASGLNCVIEQETETVYYQKVSTLMKELKLLGAHNVNNDRSKMLLGKNKLKTLNDHYQTFANSKGLPATYDVVYIKVSHA